MSDRQPHAPPQHAEPVILPRAEHGISRSQIDEHTLKVLYRLHHNGHLAYLVGGGVRDMLLNRTPKDFDVGTDATPQQIKRLFRNCFLVGRRFRLAHIRFGRNHVVEVATFRRQAQEEDLPEDPSDHFYMVQNLFGTPREDAFRRDFTINALFYNIGDFSVIDHVGGLEDLKARRLRVIGDPLVRFAEDPVRMLRALEFAARLDFTLDDAARNGVQAQAPCIAEAAPARIREEVLELFRHAVAGKVLRASAELKLLEPLLAGYSGETASFALLDRLDQWTAAGHAMDEPLALAALFLNRFWVRCPAGSNRPIAEVIHEAGEVLNDYCTYFRIAHGIRHQAKEMLIGCYRLSRGRGHRGERRFLQHPATARALTLFELWSEVTGQSRDLVGIWHEALRAPDQPSQQPGRKRRRRPRKRRPGGSQQTT